MHMLIEFAEGKKKKDFRDVLYRAIREYHSDSNGKALALNAAYNTDWYNEYLSKEDDCENVDTDNFDAESFRLALPDQTTQNALQDAQRRRPIGAYWIDHEKRWIERYPDNSSFESTQVLSQLSGISRRECTTLGIWNRSAT